MHTLFRVRSVQEETMRATGMMFQYTMKVIDVVIHSQETDPDTGYYRRINHTRSAATTQVDGHADTDVSPAR